MVHIALFHPSSIIEKNNVYDRMRPGTIEVWYVILLINRLE